MLKINLPYSMWEYKISCVYKILFADGSFYIGCSKHARSRASAWESIFRTGKGIAGETIGTNIINKIREIREAELSIVELCSVSDLKDKEAFYLFENKDNPLMLSSWDGGAWMPVMQYDKEGRFIKRHVSISSAARFNNTTIGRVQDVLNGHRKTHGDMVFVYETDYKSRRSEITKDRWAGMEKKNGRDVVMLNTDGVEVDRFKKLKEASITAGCCTQNIRRVISGKQKTAGGYIWKYA